ncbi:GNAT family N-acetyltransferase [Frankia sp. CNm7]|uniref:GNAT family N-acetyltransferase n=1 Tax=Frankia nepalensis TaxID=1836974 RepID=A0A937RLB0_9ACTN|nr:GNAT family N-acetyltransferase [Frankia nepalensis]MBL7495122.1 GNAT family N-acetyltransferase [Frankia nepalensis]MBL7515432.1 GNAT family N-acetyltransferase [Frankia nepalensis]MBL7523100.1 GNAT family N-acetyltransferase [Frankia nepalensis]MBL7632360.1 GNAT family N-acetyltransferase [Frankia nepalensis]
MLETARLVLRPLGTADIDAFVELHADERVNRFMEPFSRTEALARLAVVESQWAARGHGLLAVELKATGEFIGRAGPQYWERFGEIEIAWVLRADHWGRGYATEAARACVDWGFQNLEADYFTAMIRPANAPSRRVAERLGFAPRRADILFGHPVTVYGLDRPGRVS